MTMKNFLWLYLLVHLLFCLLIYIGIRTRILKFSEQVFPIVLLVPVFGVLAAVADYNSRFHKLGIRPISLEELHLPLEDLRLTRLEGDDRQNAVIPLEEAMSINDAETRRKLMLEILHQNPDEYISLLQEAPDMPASQRAKYTGIALEKAYRLEQLINEFFEITRFNLQSITLETNKIHLTVMLYQIADEFYPMLAEKDLTLSTELEENLILYADADKLARVMDNLLRNTVN